MGTRLVFVLSNSDKYGIGYEVFKTRELAEARKEDIEDFSVDDDDYVEIVECEVQG
jgi:hypothetical protein